MTTVNLEGLPTSLINAGVPADAPIIVAMHGIGSNEADLVPAYRAFERQAVLAFPRSPLPHPPGFAWYRLIRIGVPEPDSFDQAQRKLGEWLAALRSLEGHAGRPIVLSGFSQGAIMALSYALRQPDEVAGVIAFSGYVPQAVAESVAGRAGRTFPRFFLTQGRRDQLFPISRLGETAALLETLGVRPAVVAHDGGHDIPLVAIEAARQWFSQAFPPKPARA
jgi:phospholipase/carboxylesterase